MFHIFFCQQTSTRNKVTRNWFVFICSKKHLLLSHLKIWGSDGCSVQSQSSRGGGGERSVNVLRMESEKFFLQWREFDDTLSKSHIHLNITNVLALVLMVLVLVLMILAWVLMVLALVLKVLTALALVLMIVAQSYLIFTDGFWGYLQSKKNHWLTDWLTHSVNNIGLRDASASKNMRFKQ